MTERVEHNQGHTEHTKNMGKAEYAKGQPGAGAHRGTRYAVVTGASAGIGESAAELLAQDGWHVILAARREEKLKAVAERIKGAGGQATPLVMDVTDADSIESFARQVEQLLAGALAGAEEESGTPATLDLLVNNAGGARGLEPILETDAEDWRWMFEANVMGTLEVSRALFPLLSKSVVAPGEAAGAETATAETAAAETAESAAATLPQHTPSKNTSPDRAQPQRTAGTPQIINVVSMAGRGAYRNGAGYNAAKFGQTALTDVMRMEFADHGVRVCQVDPGRVATDFSLNRFKGDAARAEEVYADKFNLVAHDIGEVIRWVAARPPHMDVESIMIKPLDQV